MESPDQHAGPSDNEKRPEHQGAGGREGGRNRILFKINSQEDQDQSQQDQKMFKVF